MNAKDIKANIEREISLIPASFSSYSRDIIIESLDFLPVGYELIWEGNVKPGDLTWNYGCGYKSKWEVCMDSDINIFVGDYWAVARLIVKKELDEKLNPYLPMDGLLECLKGGI